MTVWMCVCVCVSKHEEKRINESKKTIKYMRVEEGKTEIYEHFRFRIFNGQSRTRTKATKIWKADSTSLGKNMQL